MTNSPRIVFLGNHTLGVRVLGVIRRLATLVGVVAHPEDPEDGVRYESVFSEARRLEVPTIRIQGKRPELEGFVRKCSPDLLWITDYRYLLPERILALAPRGAVNLHPSLLPKYRGRAVVNWAILRGETEFGLTAHFVDAGMDTGDIIAVRRFGLTQAEDVGDALDKLYPLYESVAAEVLTGFCHGNVPRRAQDHTQATEFPRRTPADGLIDWSAPAREVWNLIRAVAAPYPGAFCPWNQSRLRIWRASGIQLFSPGAVPAPGEVLDISADGQTMVVACRDAGLVIGRYEVEEAFGSAGLRPGNRLGATSELVSV